MSKRTIAPIFVALLWITLPLSAQADSLPKGTAFVVKKDLVFGTDYDGVFFQHGQMLSGSQVGRGAYCNLRLLYNIQANEHPVTTISPSNNLSWTPPFSSPRKFVLDDVFQAYCPAPPRDGRPEPHQHVLEFAKDDQIEKMICVTAGDDLGEQEIKDMVGDYFDIVLPNGETIVKPGPPHPSKTRAPKAPRKLGTEKKPGEPVADLRINDGAPDRALSCANAGLAAFGNGSDNRSTTVDEGAPIVEDGTLKSGVPADVERSNNQKYIPSNNGNVAA